jgi:hypothetical protein
MTSARPSLLRLLVIPAWLLVCALHAQPDSSLTREFAGMSAKERSQLARKEAEEAAQDAAFQAVMRDAEALFTAQRYDDALARFEEARRMRPLNVYPKVKIQDLQALIAKRNAERDAARDTAPPSPAPQQEVRSAEQVPAPPPTTAVKVPEPLSAAPTVVQAAPRDSAVKPPALKDEAPKPEPRPDRPVPLSGTPSTPTPTVTPAPAPPDGLQERTYKEGNAVVLERRLVKEGRETIYRRVNHPWGAVVYFEDGLAIPARRWAEVFEEP